MSKVKLVATKYYNDGQVERIFPYCNDPKWFILAGPADGNEAQVFKRQYPNCRIIGLEPNPNAFKFQSEHEFPDTLFNAALSSTCGDVDFNIVSNMRCGYVGNRYEQANKPIKVPSITLDQLSRDYGPFDNVALWMDIEGSEIEALKGTHVLLKQRAFQLISVEVVNESEQLIAELLEPYGYLKGPRFDVRHLKEGRVFSDLLFLPGSIP